MKCLELEKLPLTLSCISQMGENQKPKNNNKNNKHPYVEYPHTNLIFNPWCYVQCYLRCFSTMRWCDICKDFTEEINATVDIDIEKHL